MNYKVEAWSWCADYCKKNQWNPHDSYFWNKANLEYRRQHNIFEVGDNVIHHKFNNMKIYEVCEISGDLLTVFNDRKTHSFKTDVRHATDAEIKAGKRLEMNNGSI